MYRARCTPLSELQARVRNRFIPEHYPGSVERLYLWTPDEATPEFYIHSHPCIFTSKHNEMNDMKLPSWCDNDPSLFVSYHRRLLESEQVSQYLHSWIDLLFGIALSGERAVLEKVRLMKKLQPSLIAEYVDSSNNFNCFFLAVRMLCYTMLNGTQLRTTSAVLMSAAEAAALRLLKNTLLMA